VVRLVEVETGRAIAALEPPDPAPIHAMAFSPDGRHLAVTQSDQRVQIWDLVPIRRELDALGLAAGIPDIFGGATAGDDPAVERIEVEGADRAGLMRLAIRQVLHEAWIGFRALWAPRLDDAEERLGRAERWIGLGHWRLAAADCRAILARRPDSLPAASSLVRCLLNDPGGGAPSEAVRWARAAVARRPDAVDFHMMLGAALYRAGSFVEAVAELEAYLPRYQEGAGFGLLYLAMCRQRMGQAAAARAALTEALRWRDAKPAFSPADLPVFRGLLREAESVAAEELPDLPPDVFAR
jgi:tetratricopeptide (TPR) repeat protein